MDMIYKRGEMDLIILGQERGSSAANQGVS